MKFNILIMISILTLKQTHNENGSVTATSPHEMAVRIQPQRPIPLSDSSAAKKYMWRNYLMLWMKSHYYIQFIFLSLVNISSPHQPTLTSHWPHVNGLRRVTFSKLSLPILLLFGLKLDGCWTIIVATSHIYANS